MPADAAPVEELVGEHVVEERPVAEGAAAQVENAAVEQKLRQRGSFDLNGAAFPQIVESPSARCVVPNDPPPGLPVVPSTRHDCGQEDTMATEHRLFTLHGTSESGTNGWVTFLGRGAFMPTGIEVRDVSLSDLGDPSLTRPITLFAAAAEYAERQGFAGAFPTFNVAGSSYSRAVGIVLLSADVAEARWVVATDMGATAADQANHFHGVAHNWSTQHGFETGFPTHRTRGDGDGLELEVVLIPRHVGVHRRLFDHELDEPLPEHDFVERVRRLQAVAVDTGFQACIPVGWHAGQSSVMERFNNLWEYRDLCNNEGWKFSDLRLFAPHTDAAGVVHYATIVVLERDV